MEDTTTTTSKLDKGKGKEGELGLAKLLSEDNLPWVEKYRPVTLDDVVAHKDIISTSEFIYLSVNARAIGLTLPRRVFQSIRSSPRTVYLTCCSTVLLELERPRLF